MELSWRGRQVEMENWYRELAKRDDVAEVLRGDYRPFAETLAILRGSVIDVGGGAGVAGRYMDPRVEYVVVDPSAIWPGAEWAVILDEISVSGPVA